jgi:hypothetical protein
MIESLPQSAEKALDWPTALIDEKVAELKKQMQQLMEFGE